MASKTITTADGKTKKVLVGSKADPDSKNYKPKTTTSSSTSTTTSSTSKSLVPYEEALKNLDTGGLKGAQLEAAKATLINAYKTPTPTRTIVENTPTQTQTTPTAQTTPTSKKSAVASPYTSEYFAPPKPRNQIVDEMMREADGLIGSINQVYNNKRDEALKLGIQSQKEGNALSIMSGLQGGSEASRISMTRKKETEGELSIIEDARALELEGVYNNIFINARDEAQREIENARLDRAEQREMEKDRKEEMIQNLTYLAKSGAVDYDGFSTNPENSDVFKMAVKSFGGSENAVKGFFALNRPQETVLDSHWEGSTLYQAYQNPITGKVRTEIVDLSEMGYNVPKTFSKSVDLGDRIMFIPENFDPKVDEPYYISKGLTPGQQNEGGSKGYSFSAADRDGLIAGGFSLTDIDAMESDLDAGYTYNDIVNNLSDNKQKAALKTVFEGEESSTKLSRENIATLFGLSDDGGKSSFLGFEYGESGKDQLDTVMSTIARYQAVGYEDDEILKMLTAEE